MEGVASWFVDRRAQEKTRQKRVSPLLLLFVEDVAGTATEGKPQEHKVAQREKQIMIGKATVGYQRYAAEVPSESRLVREEKHPMTPNSKQECSKRSWEGQMKVWRRRLHFWTPKEATDEGKVEADFYEGVEKDEAPSDAANRPLPNVIPVEVERMELNGENSLLGQWTANSQSSAPMDLQGDSCNPAALQNKADDDEEMIFIPYQFE